MLWKNWLFFHSTGRNPGFEHISVIIYNIFAYLPFSLSTNHINMVKKWCRFSQINVFHEYFSFMSIFHIRLIFCFFPASVISSTYTDKKSRWILWMIQVNFKKWNRITAGDCLTFPVNQQRFQVLVLCCAATNACHLTHGICLDHKKTFFGNEF